MADIYTEITLTDEWQRLGLGNSNIEINLLKGFRFIITKTTAGTEPTQTASEVPLTNENTPYTDLTLTNNQTSIYAKKEITTPDDERTIILNYREFT